MNNPPAFPSIGSVTNHQGMTLRDYFAGQTLIGRWDGSKESFIAEICYKMADSMLEERTKDETI